jgi:hypothetical protein
MLQLLEDLPETVVGLRAVSEVTEEDYKQVVLPALETVHKKFGKLSLIIVLETSVTNYTPGAWLNDLKAGLKYFTDWDKIAIVSDEKMVQIVTDAVSYIMPGECKGFPMADLATAKLWVSA